MQPVIIDRKDCKFVVFADVNGLNFQGYYKDLDSAKKIIADTYHYLWYVENIGSRRNIFWFGRRLIKNPLDLWIYQGLIYETQPDVIIETGTYEGGSALYFAHLLDVLGKGKIITVDIERRDDLPKHPRIEYLIGSSTSQKIINEIKGRITEGDAVMVILDSAHDPNHVFKELELYSKLVTKDQYLIVEDTNLSGNPIVLKNRPGPLAAVNKFMAKTNKFVIDKEWERFRITSCPDGFLKRER